MTTGFECIGAGGITRWGSGLRVRSSFIRTVLARIDLEYGDTVGGDRAPIFSLVRWFGGGDWRKG